MSTQARKSESRTGAGSSSGGSMRPRNSLLLVDDEPNVGRAFKRQLRGDGYDIHLATTAEEALRILDAERIDVIVSDQNMPGRKGTDLLIEIRDRYPDTVRMIVSGAADIAEVSSAMESGAIYKFLTKPIDAALLRANISEAFSRANMDVAAGASGSGETDDSGPLRTADLDRVYQELANDARRRGKQVGLLMMQADQYHNIVGSFGYTFGEAFLERIGAVIAQCCGSDDRLADISPGTYCVLFADADPKRRMRALKRTLDEHFARSLDFGEQRIRVALCYGGTIAEQPEQTFRELLDQANSAMMAANQNGDGTIELFRQSLVKEFREQLQLEGELKHAVASELLEVFYQPQVDIVSGEIVGLEALVRWPHPERGFVSPAIFVPIAERIDLIDAIGRFVLSTSLAQFAEWDRIGCAPPEIAVNVSPLQLHASGFIDDVRTALEDSGVAADRLALEITESTAFGEEKLVEKVLAALDEIGVKRIAIDDFGTGYSNLSTLSQLAFEKLKIDRSLVPRSGNDRSEKLFSNIVSMATALGMSVLTEGVETAAELAVVYKCGCRIVQGYFYSPPVSAERLSNLLERRFEDVVE